MNDRSARLRLTTLGTFAIELDGKLISDLKTRTAEALLIYLIAHDHPLQREVLADFFWDERSQKQAFANFRAVLSRLRRHLGDYLLITRQTVGFDHSQPVWVDAFVVEQELPAILGQNLINVTELTNLLKSYHGDFLAGFGLTESRGFEAWAIARRERLRRLASLGLEKLTTYAHNNGDYLAGIHWGEQWRNVDLLSETATQQLMWLYARNGQKHLALTSYEKCRQLLHSELAISPSPATQQLRQKISQLPIPSPNKLPHYLTPLIGREAEQSQLIQRLLRENVGILTIAGMGGSGKSRLAVAVAQTITQDYAGRFLDGAYFISLVTVTDGESFFNQIAGTLDIKLKGDKIAEQLLITLADHEYLIVLDNFEQLIDDETVVEFLIQWLKNAPATRLIITSRQRLMLQTEQLFTLAGLAYPTRNDAPVQSYEAGQLFLERVEWAGGKVDDDTAPVWQICKIVDGSPLAVELAAGSVGELSPAEIASAIQENIDTLATTMRDMPARHRSIRAVFNHSWYRLPPDEQEILAKLTVFPASFAGKSANAITNANLAQLRTLARKSLLQEVGEFRFELHPLVRTMAGEQLKQSTQIRRQHAQHYLDWLAKEREAIVGAEQSQVLDRVQMEIENVRTAWGVGLANGDWSHIDQAIATMHTFFVTRGWFIEAEAFFRRGAERVEADFGGFDEMSDATALTLARLISRQGWFTFQLSDFEKARLLMAQCRHQFNRLQAHVDLAHVLHDEGLLLRRIGEYEAAKTLLLESLALRQKAENGRVIAGTLINLGNTTRMLGDYDGARTYLLEARRILQTHPDPSLLASVTNDLGEVARAVGDLASAKGFYEEALIGYTAINDLFGMGACHNNLGSVAHRQADFESAKGHAQQSYQLFRETGTKRGITYPLCVLGRIARDEGDFDGAMVKYREAYGIADEIGYLPKALETLFEIGILLQAVGETHLAVALFVCLQEQPKLDDETRKGIGERLAEMPAFSAPTIPTLSQMVSEVWRYELPANIQ